MRPTVKALQLRVDDQQKKISAVEAELEEMKRFLPDYWRTHR